ncbi:hypothetical protein GCM10009801_53060 [Streptomyces albiaxialis]|uniref:Putative restriction endonuclease domain-containing protein n=1 Tax=Streptomyces albiaxialis TaxID=329523 RepID=A0ABN2WC78_9ACTN
MGVEPVPSWVIPPPGGFTAEGFLRLTGMPPHTELIDGALVFAARRGRWHSRVINRLLGELDRQAPAELRADREMTVKLGKRQAPEPDVLVVTAEAYAREDPSTYYFPEDVVLAVEAVSPDSEDRDRTRSPASTRRRASRTTGASRTTAAPRPRTSTSATPRPGRTP